MCTGASERRHATECEWASRLAPFHRSPSVCIFVARMSLVPDSSVPATAVPPASGGDTGDPSLAAVVTAADSEVERVSAVLVSVVPGPAVPPAPDDGTVEIPPAAVVPDRAGVGKAIAAPNEPIASTDSAPLGPVVVSGASVAGAAVSLPVPSAPPGKQFPHSGAANNDSTLGPLDRALLNVLGELRWTAQALRDHSRV